MLLNLFHSGGAWIIPVGMAIVTIFLIKTAIKQYNSPSTKLLPDGTIVPAGKAGFEGSKWFVICSVAMFILTVAVFFGMAAEYKGV